MQQFWKEEKNKVMPILVILGADFFFFLFKTTRELFDLFIDVHAQSKECRQSYCFFILSCSTQHDELFVLKITS